MINVMSTFLEETVLCMIFKSGSYPSTSGSIWLALYTDYPWKSGSGTEVTGGGYSRKKTGSFINLSGEDETIVSGGPYGNARGIVFDPASTDWGLITHWGVTLNPTGMSASELLFFGEFNNPKNVFADDALRIQERDLTLQFSGGYSPYLSDTLFNTFLNGDVFPTPGSSIYLGVLIATRDEYGDEMLVEPVGGNYDRALISGSWTLPVSGSLCNSGSVAFPIASENWGVLSGIGIYNRIGVMDAYVSYQLFEGRLDETQEVLAGDSVRFPIGKLNVVADLISGNIEEV